MFVTKVNNTDSQNVLPVLSPTFKITMKEYEEVLLSH